MQGKVVLVEDLIVGCAQLVELLNELGIAQHGVCVVGRVIDDTEAELGVRRARRRLPKPEATNNRSKSFFTDWSPSCFQRFEGMVCVV